MLVLFNLFISKGHSWGWTAVGSLLVLCGAVICTGVLWPLPGGERRCGADACCLKPGLALRRAASSCSTAAVAP